MVGDAGIEPATICV